MKSAVFRAYWFGAELVVINADTTREKHRVEGSAAEAEA